LNTLRTIPQCVGTRAIRLTAKEYALLELLMLHAGKTLGRETIARNVWDEQFESVLERDRCVCESFAQEDRPRL